MRAVRLFRSRTVRVMRPSERLPACRASLPKLTPARQGLAPDRSRVLRQATRIDRHLSGESAVARSLSDRRSTRFAFSALRPRPVPQWLVGTPQLAIECLFAGWSRPSGVQTAWATRTRACLSKTVNGDRRIRPVTERGYRSRWGIFDAGHLRLAELLSFCNCAQGGTQRGECPSVECGRRTEGAGA